MPKPTPITSLEQLKALSASGGEFFLTLKYKARSSKHIKWNETKSIFEVENYIDGSHQKLSPEELMNENLTNIGKAMLKNALFKC